MIFVTGGTGLVGGHLLLNLTSQNIKLKAFKCHSTKLSGVKRLFNFYQKSHLFELIQWVEGDLLDTNFVENILGDVDCIYHIAALVSFDERLENKIFETNVTITENLVNESIASNIKEFIYVSSIATMDELNYTTMMIDENSAWNNEIPHSSYSLSKFKAEIEVWRGTQEGLNAIIVNPGVIIGSLDGKRASEAIFSKSLKNRFIPSGATGFVDVRDVVNLILLLQKEKLYNKKYILVSENLSYKYVISLVAKINNLSVKMIPNNVLKLVHYLSQLSRLFGGKYLTFANYKSLVSITKYDNSKIKAIFDYEFISIKEAIKYHSQMSKKQYLD